MILNYIDSTLINNIINFPIRGIPRLS